MPFIDRDDEGRIVGAFAMMQREGQEWADDWPEVPREVPWIVSRFQLLAALSKAELLDEVMAWAHAPETDPLHRLALDVATEFRRDSPALAAAAQALGWQEGRLDQLLLEAEDLRP